ncbi:hypothetical protein C7402_106171 [Paraburkholderia unamae]|uniref:Uncharacterized protein n=1 Tax=Paraburkholderia unamae TaxID=219649 RepID=A0ABX5KNA1_9BURK|nr:hypothetical protein C7402_106171 [Paraburkholderia unamae]
MSCEPQEGYPGLGPRGERRLQAINGYFTCARGWLLTPLDEKQRVARMESRTGRDGAHRHVRSGTAPTVTEHWYKEFIRRVPPRGRSDRRWRRWWRKYGERPKRPGNVQDMATSKSGETSRGGRRAFLTSFPCAARIESVAANLIQPYARAVRRCGRRLSWPLPWHSRQVDRKRRKTVPSRTRGMSLRFLKTYFACAHAAPSSATQRRTGAQKRQFSPPSFPLQRACDNTIRRGSPLPAPCCLASPPRTVRLARERTGVVL